MRKVLLATIFLYMAPSHAISETSREEYSKYFFLLSEECNDAETSWQAEQKITDLELEWDRLRGTGKLSGFEISDLRKEISKCKIHSNNLPTKKAKEIVDGLRLVVEQRRAIEEQRRNRVITEAYLACLELDEMDPIVARTSTLCHRLFLQNRYRDE